MLNKKFWKNKKVFITGHTGFKGSWLCLWLKFLGADVKGYALKPPTSPNLFNLCRISEIVKSKIANIKNYKLLKKELLNFKPEIVIHMAAQPIVRESYKNPLETYSINVMGTVHLFEAVRNCKSVRVVVNVTTDKCYENKERKRGYCEDEPLGGYDPYSNSKACSELVTSSYRSSFFNSENYKTHKVAIASARAGNVIGGGDWAVDRLIPDCVRAILRKKFIVIRNPNAIRPWQHVLEPLSGYLILAEKLYINGPKYVGAWNFGPDDSNAKTVEWIVKKICNRWEEGASYKIDKGKHPYEAHYLKLNCSKAKSDLNWYSKWSLDTTIDKIIEWTKAYKNKEDLREVCLKQIKEYINR